MKEIDVGKIRYFMQLAADIKLMTAQHKSLREKLIKLLKGGATCSSLSPWILVISPSDRTVVNWKGLAQGYIKKEFGNRWRAEVKRIEKEAPKTPIDRLLSQPNPHFRKSKAAK